MSMTAVPPAPRRSLDLRLVLYLLIAADLVYGAIVSNAAELIWGVVRG